MCYDIVVLKSVLGVQLLCQYVVEDYLVFLSIVCDCAFCTFEFNYGCDFKDVSWEEFALIVCILVPISLPDAFFP